MDVWARVCFFALGMGVTKDALRRPSTSVPVGWPFSSNSQCRDGAWYGELRMGEEKNVDVIAEGNAASGYEGVELTILASGLPGQKRNQ